MKNSQNSNPKQSILMKTIGYCSLDFRWKLGAETKTEKALYACNYDFAIANELSMFCHFNFSFLMNIIERFSGDYKEACSYLRNVRNSQSRSQATTHCKTALEILQSFRGNGIAASDLLEKFRDDTCAVQTFMSKFDNNGEEASSFLSSFDNDVERTNNFHHKFNDKGGNADKYLKNLPTLQKEKHSFRNSEIIIKQTSFFKNLTIMKMKQTKF